MRIVFRADANSQIGTGHLMRCLTLADKVRERGAECMFFCRASGLGILHDRIKAAGHGLMTWGDQQVSQEFASRTAACHAWLPGGWQRDVQACLDRLSGARPEWLVVDHYGIDWRWEEAMRRETGRLLVIDDVADRKHACDLLLDQNLVPGMSSRYDGLLPAGARALLGPRYALLRPEFANPGRVRRTAAVQPRLLVMYGGADRQELTLRTVRILADIKWSGGADVVVGPLYANCDALREPVKGIENAVLHAPAWNIAELMAVADLALGSPGATSWERCACALPAVTISQADNQEAIGVGLQEAGAHCYLGRAESVTDEEIAAALMRLANDLHALAEMSLRASAITDGSGAERVAQLMMELK